MIDARREMWASIAGSMADDGRDRTPRTSPRKCPRGGRPAISWDDALKLIRGRMGK